MKVIAIILLFLSLLSHDAKRVVNACECISRPTVKKSLQSNNIDYVFRGYVKRQINVGSGNINEPKYYNVRVWRVYKGCTFSNETSIVVETAGNSALCGVGLQLKENYVFSGRSEAADPKVIKIAQKMNPRILSSEMVRIQQCDFNAPFTSLTRDDKNLVRNQTNRCTK
jgi:Tissue inhibitor of metalloproteinase